LEKGGEGGLPSFIDNGDMYSILLTVTIK
jgi:hypothetical protein